MTTSRDQRASAGETRDAEFARLEQVNAQLLHAVDAHATVDQAIGVLIAVHRLPPAAGFEVLREVSQHLNVKLHTIAVTLIRWALGHQPLPEPLGEQLDAALRRCSQHDPPEQPESSG
ncbi:ANTAR domain-containing protein [Streptomyces hilarionis]|uniref:ANTAR domain-containing protein n=1 Tax=Streptomyces hilarionis TaxID=2839954 RepID=UPI00211A8254|nr:ANTAR domain-containing protein [Streptomyces hilarionis]MCQ9130211.1 ANTAR domain-containing protein [Streptomyces hilarionis]